MDATQSLLPIQPQSATSSEHTLCTAHSTDMQLQHTMQADPLLHYHQPQLAATTQLAALRDRLWRIK
jgi:hypothetical protein